MQLVRQLVQVEVEVNPALGLPISHPFTQLMKTKPRSVVPGHAGLVWRDRHRRKRGREFEFRKPNCLDSSSGIRFLWLTSLKIISLMCPMASAGGGAHHHVVHDDRNFASRSKPWASSTASMSTREPRRCPRHFDRSSVRDRAAVGFPRFAPCEPVRRGPMGGVEGKPRTSSRQCCAGVAQGRFGDAPQVSTAARSVAASLRLSTRAPMPCRPRSASRRGPLPLRKRDIAP